MFSEYFARRPLREDMCAAPVWFPQASDRAAWEGLSADVKQQLADFARDYRTRPYPMRRASDFLAFVRSGSRRADEDPYFFRRRKLCAATMGYCLAPNEEDLNEAIDGLWCICEESSWVISAHNENHTPQGVNQPLPNVEDPVIDLFAAQTAMVVSLACSLLGDALMPVVRSRVEREIRLRVLEPFMTTDRFWWMGVTRKDLNNWTPWIVSNIMFTACQWPVEDLPALLERACTMLDRWLACIPADGGCDEGAGYWNVAGGSLAECLEVLQRVTDGRVSFWQDEKLRRVMAFPLQMRVQGRWFVNFADCDARPRLSGDRLQWVGEQMGSPALMAMGAEMRSMLVEQLNDTPHFWRMVNMVFHPACSGVEAPPAGDAWLQDLQVRLVRCGGMTLCAKGGHNNESHNHNDVGSFMLYVDGEPEVVDAGNMIYTAKTFSGERYSLWNVRGAYHNVPIIGGREQQPGAQYAAREVQCLPDGMALDMAGAYDGVEVCRRTLRLTEDGLLLQDEIQTPQPEEAAWVFMLRNRPEIGPASLRAGKITIGFHSDLAAEAEEIPITDGRMANHFPGSLWRVILRDGASQQHKKTLIIGRGD